MFQEAVAKNKSKHRGKPKDSAWAYPVGTVRLYTVKTVQHGKHIRVRKRYYIKQQCGKWIPLARHNWQERFGPVPPDSEVVYIGQPPDIPFSQSQDDVENLKLVYRFSISHTLARDKRWAKKRARRHRQAIVEANKQRWRIFNSLAIREVPHIWYPLDYSTHTIWMHPQRTKRLAIEEVQRLGGQCQDAVRGVNLFKVVTAAWQRRCLDLMTLSFDQSHD